MHAICPACQKDPDPRGPSACASCRALETAARNSDDMLPGLGRLVREGKLVPDDSTPNSTAGAVYLAMHDCVIAPTFSHTRVDSALVPCAVCVQELTGDQKLRAFKEACDTFEQWILDARGINDDRMAAPNVPTASRIAEHVAFPYLARFVLAELENMRRDRSDIRAAVVAKMAPQGSPIEPHEWEPAASMTTLDVVKGLVASNLAHLNQRMRGGDDREAAGEENRRLLKECAQRNVEINLLNQTIADRDRTIRGLRASRALEPAVLERKDTSGLLQALRDVATNVDSVAVASRFRALAKSAVEIIEGLGRELEDLGTYSFDHFVEYKRRRNEQFAAYEKLVVTTNQEIAELTTKVEQLTDKGVIAGQKKTIEYMSSERDRLLALGMSTSTTIFTPWCDAASVGLEHDDAARVRTPEELKTRIENLLQTRMVPPRQASNPDRFATSPSTGMGPLSFDNELARLHGWTNEEIAAFWDVATAMYKATSNKMHKRYPDLYDLRHPDDPIYIGADKNGRTLKLDPP